MTKNTKIILVVLAVVLVSFFVYFYIKIQKPETEFLGIKNGKVLNTQLCGDGVCDSLEKKDPHLCPKDCSRGNSNTTTNTNNGLSSDSRFGFLNAYGQSMKNLSEIWNKSFKKDLVKTSSELVDDISVGWSREFVFVYPSAVTDSYTLSRYNRAKLDGTKLIATVGVDENKMNDSAYNEWLKETIEYYSGYIKYWQIHNEVGSDRRFPESDSYIELLKKTSAVIKEECSDCKIMMGSFAPGDFLVSNDYYKDVIEKGDSYVDVYDFHIFDEKEFETFKDFASRIDKTIFVTEMATYSGQPLVSGKEYQSEKKQAETLIKWYTQAFAGGADYVFWAQFVEWYKFLGSVDGLFDFTGLVYNGMCNSSKTADVCKDTSIDKGAGVKKEAYRSLKALISKIDRFVSVDELRDGQFKFELENKIVYILWCADGNCSLPQEVGKSFQAFDYLGNKISSDKLTLSDSPVFVEVSN